MKRHRIYVACLIALLPCGSNILAVNPLDKEMVVQQTMLIKGTVVDKQGEPIIGANVSAKGTTLGTITDINGEFSLNVPEKSILIISYLGFTTQEVSIENNTVFNIVLEEDTQILNEVVVIGYGTSRKKDITGSVSSVKADELNAVSSSSINQMLQGRVTGVNTIQGSAQPGASIVINIRGAASPNGDNSPLYVIDGIPMQNNGKSDAGLLDTSYDGGSRDPLNSINPNDIESIEVLKDASAAAIYGASAANGVILITTKSGKEGKVKVSYQSTLTAQLMKAYPEVLNAHDFREQTNLWTREFFLYQNKMGVYGNNPIDWSGYTPVFADVDGYTADTKWIDEITRTGYIIDQNVSVNGGTGKTRYYFSYNFYDHAGVMKNSDMRRHTLRMNLDQEFSSHFKAGVKINYSNLKANSVSTGSHRNADNMVLNVPRYAPDIPVKDENGKYSLSHNKLFNNPVSFLEFQDESVTERIFIAPTFELKLIDGLTLKGQGGYDRQNNTHSFYIPVSTQNHIEPEGRAQLAYQGITNISAEAFFNYEKVIHDIHRFSGVLGAGYYQTASNYYGLSGSGFFTDAFGSDNVGIAENKDKEIISSWRNERIKLSQFLRINYSLLDKYILTFTARRDGSSYFAENNKWGIFPSVSAAWRVNEEAFMKDKTIFSDLKLRVGYGTVGNENVLGTNALSLYKSGYNYLFGKTMNTGLALTQIENPNLKWETNYTLNIGIDYEILNQRISGSIEFFHRGVKDLLDYQTLPSNNAVGRVTANIGETRSRGFEFSLQSDNLTLEAFKWNTTFNLSYFKTNWVKRNPEVALADYIGEKDELDAIYGWKTNGIITSAADIPSYMPNAAIGNVKYVDNGDGVLDSGDVVKLGNKTPRWMAGLGNTFSYKGFDLNVYFYGAFGYKKVRGLLPDLQLIGNSGVAASNTYAGIKTDVYNSQTGNGWMPGVATNVYDSSNPTGTNNFNLMDGSYVKLKNITLGYTLPRDIFTGSKFIQGARFFVDAQNLATFTKYEGFDPELASENPYPQAVSLSFGFNLDF
jgi:TonB-linked SusC/RagA family outer membrane protein